VGNTPSAEDLASMRAIGIGRRLRSTLKANVCIETAPGARLLQVMLCLTPAGFCSERRRNRTFQPWGCQGLPLLKGVVCRDFVVVWASVLRLIRAEGPGVALRLLQPRSRDLDTVLPVPLNRRRTVVAAPAFHAGYQYVSAWFTTLRRDSIALMLQPRSCNAPESVPAG
jgi:hypothetical protein